MYRKRNIDYIQKLLIQDKRVFRVAEMALAWGMQNSNTLNTTCKRYQRSGKLHRLIRGVYSVVPIDKLHPYEVGVSVAGSLSYVSLETVLFNEGVINQAVRKVTLVGKKHKEFTIGGTDYLCRYMPLVNLVDRSGIEIMTGYEIASKDRAIRDKKRLSPLYYFDNGGI